MALVRFDLDQELEEVRREVNRMFGNLPAFSTAVRSRAPSWNPQMDTAVKDGHVVITLDVPGMGSDDVTVEVTGTELMIRGSRTIEYDGDEREWFRRERSSGAFERRLALPEGIDASRVTATFANGVLTVNVPVPERVLPHRIPVMTVD